MPVTGWSQSGGPWVRTAQSMRYLTSGETVISGGRRIDQLLPVPTITTFPNAGGINPVQNGPPFTAADYQDVRVIAFRRPMTEADDKLMSHVKATSKTIKGLDKLLDGSLETSVQIGKAEQFIDLEFDEATTAQSLRIDPVEVLYTLDCKVECSDDGTHFRQLVQHSEQRGHQGPRRKDPILIPFPETTAKYFRVKLSASRPVPIAGIALSRRAVLASYVRKQLGETSPSVRPPWDTYIWGAQSDASAGSTVMSSEVIDLSQRMA
jgi:hypothetical protein